MFIKFVKILFKRNKFPETSEKNQGKTSEWAN